MSWIIPRLFVCLLLASCALASVTMPAGISFEVRLMQPVATYSSKQGTPVEAVVISPIRVGDRTLVPIGSRLRGELGEVKRIGLGLRRGRATLSFEFTHLEFPDGTTVDVRTRLKEVNNAREKVDDSGRVQGIRATDPVGHRAAGIARNLFLWDPLLHTILTGSTLAVLRFPESEIHLPAGTEMVVELAADVEVRDDWTVPLPRVAATDEEREALLEIVRDMTYHGITEKHLRPADIVNILILGEEEWLERAFDAAGWVRAHRLTIKTGWMAFRSVAEAAEYREAPMSVMLLDEQRPDLELSKALNTFSKRHHLRAWRRPSEWRDKPMFAAASTHDVAIDISFKRLRLEHLIDRNIDNERAKVVNDLVYAGCVDAAELIERPWVPHDVKTSGGQRLITDGRLLVIELNPCRSPRLAEVESDPIRVRGNIWQRVPRQVILTLRHDFTRNNPIYQACLGVKYLFQKSTRRSPRHIGPTRSSTVPAEAPPWTP